MSELTRKPPIKALTVTVAAGKRQREFLVPEDKAKGLVCLIEEFEVGGHTDSAFDDLNNKYSKAGALLKGARLREELTQKQLAERLAIPQSHISAMERGNRPIGRKMATKLARVLHVSHRIFL